MQDEQSHFDRLASWLTRQWTAVRQVEDDQATAEQLVARAEDELGELRADLANVDYLTDEVRLALSAKA
jgi:hypothetical protein